MNLPHKSWNCLLHLQRNITTKSRPVQSVSISNSRVHGQHSPHWQVYCMFLLLLLVNRHHHHLCGTPFMYVVHISQSYLPTLNTYVITSVINKLSNFSARKVRLRIVSACMHYLVNLVLLVNYIHKIYQVTTYTTSKKSCFSLILLPLHTSTLKNLLPSPVMYQLLLMFHWNSEFPSKHNTS